MIGDSLSQDRMCGRYLAYANIPRLCRACNVTPEESEDPSHVCNYLFMQQINQKCKEAMKVFFPNNYDNNEDILSMTKEQLKQKQQTKQQELQALSQHIHCNTFENVWLGSNKYGLLESLPHDMMHAFLHGVLMYVLEVIMSPLNPSEKFKLDVIVDKIIVPVRSTYKAQFPRCSFTRGITNLTLLTADERAGVAFVLALVAASKPGSDLLAKAAARIESAAKRGEKVNAEMDDDGNLLEEIDIGEDDEEEIVVADSLCQPKNMLEMLELLLAFHAWYQRGHPFSLQDDKEKFEMQQAIRIMMNQIKKFAPRKDKNGWRLQKFHDLLHIVRDIENYGSPNNIDAAPNENNLIDFAKRPGRRAHKKERFLFPKSARDCVKQI